MEKEKCGNCRHFVYEDTDGRGFCQITKIHTKSDEICWLDQEERKKIIRKEIRNANVAFDKHRQHCANIRDMAADILRSRGVDPDVVFYDFSCSHLAGDNLCLTFEYGKESPYVLSCISFFQYFEESYKTGDNIIDELIKMSVN